MLTGVVFLVELDEYKILLYGRVIHFSDLVIWMYLDIF
jgi:hypothetical protein